MRKRVLIYFVTGAGLSLGLWDGFLEMPVKEYAGKTDEGSATVPIETKTWPAAPANASVSGTLTGMYVARKCWEKRG